MTIQKILLIALISLFFELAHAAPNGQILFEDNCAGCHGEKGLGGIGLPISKIHLANEFTDHFLKKTIREGRPGRIMPAYPDFSDAQLNAIVSYMRSWVDKTPEDLPLNVAGNAELGAALYQTHCSECHGTQGKGGAGTGVTHSRVRSHKIMPPALNNSGFLASVSDRMLFNTISNGRKSSGMPASNNLSDEQKADLIAYIRTWENSTPKAKTEQATAESAALIIDSPHSFEQTVTNLKESINGRNYRIFPDRALEQGLFKKGEYNEKQLTIRVCNFKRLYHLLNLEPRLGVVLPCRISVVENDDGSVQIIAPNMALVSKIFNNDQLSHVFKELNEDMLEIIDEATL